MLDTLWKVVGDIIDTRLKACIIFHAALHGLCVGRGRDMAILELKLDQDLYRIYQDPLLLMFLDLYKAYDTLDWDHLLKTMEGYGIGPHLCRILAEFWECHEVVTRKMGTTALTSSQ